MSQQKNKTTFIFIGDGFDEYEVILFLHRFRRAGLRISSVSLSDRLVYSRQGVGLKADFQLFDWSLPSSDCLLILPAGGGNERKLRQDARLRNLLHSLNPDHTEFAVTAGRSPLVDDVLDQTGKPVFLPQEQQDLVDFAEKLVDHISI